MTMIVAAQLVALHVLAAARPIGLVFEVDQMRVVSAADVDPDLLTQAPDPCAAQSSLAGTTRLRGRPAERSRGGRHGDDGGA
jgi:hypothetical protein